MLPRLHYPLHQSNRQVIKCPQRPPSPLLGICLSRHRDGSKHHFRSLYHCRFLTQLFPVRHLIVTPIYGIFLYLSIFFPSKINSKYSIVQPVSTSRSDG
jgi:hypothetical protein